METTYVIQFQITDPDYQGYGNPSKEIFEEIQEIWEGYNFHDLKSQQYESDEELIDFNLVGIDPSTAKLINEVKRQVREEVIKEGN